MSKSKPLFENSIQTTDIQIVRLACTFVTGFRQKHGVLLHLQVKANEYILNISLWERC